MLSKHHTFGVVPAELLQKNKANNIDMRLVRKTSKYKNIIPI